MTDTRRAVLLVLAFGALWAAVEALAGGVLRRYSPYQVVWTRYVVHLTLMVLVWGWRQPRSLVRTRRPVYQIGRSLLMLGMPASWITAMQAGVPAGTTMSIFWLSPLLILGFAHVLLGERASHRVWIAATVAAAAASALFGPRGVANPLLLLFPLGMAVSFSLYVALTRPLRSETTRANLFYSALGVAACLTPVMPRLWISPDAGGLLVMSGVGVLGFATLWALDRATAAAPVSRTAPFFSFQLLFTAGLDWVLHGARPGLRGAAALAVVALAGAALWVWPRERAFVVEGAT
jgi:drug/metabolite transporter (DMT)-like permease